MAKIANARYSNNKQTDTRFNNLLLWIVTCFCREKEITLHQIKAFMQEDILIQIGNRLKDIRKDKNITLQELANAAGVTKSMLSQVENSRSVPSLSVLLNLIKALDIDLNEFFKNIKLLDTDAVLFKKNTEYQSFEKENAIGFNYKRIFSTEINNYHIDFVLLSIAGDAQRPMVITNAYEFKYLISGKVEYTIGEKKYVMEEGDSIFFDAKIPHHPKSMGTDDALLLVVYFFNNANELFN